MSVDPSNTTSNVVASPEKTTLTFDIPTRAVQPAERLVFSVFRSDVKLTIIEHLNRVNAVDWKTPLGLLVAIILTLATSHFHDFLKVPAAVWAAGYGIVGIACVWKLLECGFKLWRMPPMSVDELVDKCIEPQGNGAH